MTTLTRTNKYPAPCQRCGEDIPARSGELFRDAGQWRVRHLAATWKGSPVSGGWAGGCPADTAALNLQLWAARQGLTAPLWDEAKRLARAERAPVQAPQGADLREVSRRAGSKYAYTASGARMTASSRRCIDAPCCGCCD
jgi:hypothetical protein